MTDTSADDRVSGAHGNRPGPVRQPGAPQMGHHGGIPAPIRRITPPNRPPGPTMPTYAPGADPPIDGPPVGAHPRAAWGFLRPPVHAILGSNHVTLSLTTVDDSAMLRLT